MEKESYFGKIEHYITLSVGLKSYLNYIVYQRRYSKKQTLKLSDTFFATLQFINSGTLRLYTVQEEGETTLFFWQKDQFLSPMNMLNILSPAELHVEFLEETVVTSYKEKHTSNLYKLFPDYRELVTTVYQHQIAELVLRTTSLAHQNSNARFESLMKSHPELFNLCDLKIIANYLGIHPKVLSQLRSKAVKR